MATDYPTEHMNIAMLEPTETLLKYEEAGQNFERLAMLEELKTKPFGIIIVYSKMCLLAKIIFLKFRNMKKK